MTAPQEGRKPVILFPFFGNSVGGSHRATLSLISQLPESFRARVVLHGRGPLSEILDQAGIPHEYLPYAGAGFFRDGRLGQLVSTLYQGVRAARFLQREGIEIVHTNDARMHLIWGLAARLCKTRHIWHQHSLFPVSRMTAKIVSWSDLVLSVSAYIADSAPTGSKDGPMVSGNPLTVKPLEFPQGMSAAKSKYDVINLLSVSNLRPVKRPDFLAQTLLHLYRLSGRPVQLTHLGGDKDNLIEGMKAVWESQNVPVHIETPGFVEDVGAYMAAADGLVAAARREGFGLTLLEAMARGVPVFACAAGGHLEIIHDRENGFLIDADDPRLAAQQIWAGLTDSTSLNRVRYGGLETVKAYDPRICAERMVDRYRKLLA